MEPSAPARFSIPRVRPLSITKNALSILDLIVLFKEGSFSNRKAGASSSAVSELLPGPGLAAPALTLGPELQPVSSAGSSADFGSPWGAGLAAGELVPAAGACHGAEDAAARHLSR